MTLEELRSAALPGLRDVIAVRVAAEVRERFSSTSSPLARAYARSRNATFRAAIEAILDHVHREVEADGAAEILAISPMLSDSHDGGQTVTRIELADGTIHYYKPRSTSVAPALAGFLAYLHRRGVAARIQLPHQRQRQTYLWAAAVKRDADDAAAALGEALAVFWLLGSVDLHAENVCTASGRIWLIDEETALHPELATAGYLPGFDSVRSPILSGLLSMGEPEVVATRFVVTDPSVTLECFERTLSALASLARKDLAAELAVFDTTSVRVVLRSTHLYCALLRNRDTGDWEQWVVDRLAQPAGGIALPPPIRDAELRSLRRGDVPAFTVQADQHHVRTADHTLSCAVPFETTASAKLYRAAEALTNGKTVPGLVDHLALLVQAAHSDPPTRGCAEQVSLTPSSIGAR